MPRWPATRDTRRSVRTTPLAPKYAIVSRPSSSGIDGENSRRAALGLGARARARRVVQPQRRPLRRGGDDRRRQAGVVEARAAGGPARPACAASRRRAPSPRRVGEQQRRRRVTPPGRLAEGRVVGQRSPVGGVDRGAHVRGRPDREKAVAGEGGRQRAVGANLDAAVPRHPAACRPIESRKAARQLRSEPRAGSASVASPPAGKQRERRLVAEPGPDRALRSSGLAPVRRAVPAAARAAGAGSAGAITRRWPLAPLARFARRRCACM